NAGKRQYRKDLRGHIIFDVIEEILQEGIKVDLKLFDRYKLGAVRQIILEKDEIDSQLIAIKKQSTELNNEIRAVGENLFQANDKSLMKRLNDKLNELEDTKSKLLDKQITMEESAKLIEKHIKNQTRISYEKFAELFEYAN